MTRKKYLALARKNLEIVFYVRDGQNGNPEIVHEIVSKLPDKVLTDLSNSYAPAELLIKEKYFSSEDIDDLAIECERAFFITNEEVTADEERRAFSLA